jgi:hypothetical protein
LFEISRQFPQIFNKFGGIGDFLENPQNGEALKIPPFLRFIFRN